ncbi:ATP-binding protein [Candidatus Woesearchaeota archaeon]|nr:ATP-binding protein [Candidatus Woesearchaeota archaeon]
MWYNDLGFMENPFDDNANKKLVGYENILDEVIYNIKAGNIIFIEGKNGFGKTAILKRAIEEFRGFRKVAYVDCSKVKDINVEDVLMGKYNFIERLFKKTPRDMIVLVDDVNELDKKNTERLKFYYDQNYIKSVIFTGDNYNKLNFSESLKDRIKNVITLPELKDFEAVDMLNSRLDGKKLIQDDIAKEIFERTNNNPREFLRICEELCKSIAETKEETVTMEHVNKILPTKKSESSAKKNIEKAKKPEKAAKKKDEKSEELRIVYEQEDAAERYY